MSRKPSLKPKPKPGPTVAIASKKAAAIGQLESAILLWFNEADPISILVLASNAEDCYHALGKHFGKPSFYKTWLETMPKSFQERAKYIQDFAKHGFMDLDEDAPFDERYAIGLMISAIVCHEQLDGKSSPLMKLYSTRVYFENPSFVLLEARPHFVKGATAYGLGSGSRKKFFNKYEPILKKLR